MKCQVELRSSHLVLIPDIGNGVLDGADNVYVAYKSDVNALLVSPKSNSWFPKLHKSLEFMLKSKDLIGTKSIAIRELLIDEEIDDGDKRLECTINEEKKYLKIDLPNITSE